MDIEQLKKQLSKFGTIEVIKAGVVFTLLMKGKDLANSNTVSKINMDVIEAVGDKYPKIEAMKNDDDFFLIVLKA